MAAHAADGAALIAAAVSAAIRERAPRRTVAAVAAAVAGTLVSATARPTPPATRSQVCARDDAQTQAADEDDPAQLLSSLRAARRKIRLRRKERRRVAKQAAREAQTSPTQPQQAQPSEGAADQHTGPGGVPAVASAQVPSAAVSAHSAQSEQPAAKLTQENLRGAAPAVSGAAAADATSVDHFTLGRVSPEPSDLGTVRTFGRASAASRSEPYAAAPHRDRGRGSSGGTGKGRPAPTRR